MYISMHNFMEVTIMKGQMENQYGTVLIDENVIALFEYYGIKTVDVLE